MDNLSKEDRIKTMRAVKSKHTAPERKLHAMLAGLGISGWRMNPEDIKGKPDFVFDKNMVAVFVDGCFWHGCPICNRSLPVSNREYWKKKINRNMERDKARNQTLKNAGWSVIRIWEHELSKGEDIHIIRERILKVLEKE